jgi:hypothetical protein
MMTSFTSLTNFFKATSNSASVLYLVWGTFFFSGAGGLAGSVGYAGTIALGSVAAGALLI